MDRASIHKRKFITYTFKRWSNKSYSAFLSLGKQIRIGWLKVVMSAGLSSKSKIGKKAYLNTLTFLSGHVPDEGPWVKEDPDLSPGFSRELLFAEGLLLFAVFSIKQTCRSRRRNFKWSGPGRPANVRYFLSVLYILLLISSAGLQAQQDTTIVLNEVSITGNRITIPFNEASRNTNVIERKQIDISPVQSLPEVLSYIPGVDIRQRGPAGVQADISIRGGTFEQTLVLVNGIKMTDPQTGHHVLSLPFNMDDVERIEVLKGPGARIYGQNAFAGAVNFFTRVPERREILLRGYGGSFGSFGGGLTVSLPVKRYKQYISFGGDLSGGYRYNTDYKNGNFFYQSELVLPAGLLSLTGGWTGRKFGANGFYASPDYEDQYEEVRTFLTGISFKREERTLKYNARVYWRGNHDRYVFVRDDPGMYENYHRTNVFGAEWHGSVETKAGITGVGLEYRKEMINGDWVRDETESKSNLDGFSRDQTGLFLEQRFKIRKKVDLTPGIYVSWYSDFGWNVFPGLDIGYGLNKYWRIYANTGKSYRIPTFYDQYYQSPVEQGNPELKPEQAWTWEAGVKFGRHGLMVEGNLFYRMSDDLIDWVRPENDSIWEATNIRQGRTLGGELAITLDFNAITGKDYWLRQIIFSYNYIDSRLDETEAVQSRYALQNLRNQLITGVWIRIVGKLKNSFMFRLIDRVGQDSYVLLDDRLYWEQNEKFTVFLEATNFTDQSYTEVMTPMPGRWIRAGIRWGMGF